MEINQVALAGFYETHKEAYYSRRLSSDKKLWDEQYKWDILPALNQKLSGFTSVTKDNITDFMSIITDNSNKSNFAHWIDMDDLKLLAELPYGHQILDIVWSTTPDSVGDAIDTANNISNSFAPHKKFSPSTWGYILAAKDCTQFSIYRDSVLKELVEVNAPVKTKGLAQGEKYQLLNDSVRYLGELIADDSPGDVDYAQKALNGQDFLWVTLVYS
ncbi:hypothetical protein GX865_03910 [Candidatus Saccharibacteria bacterium]|jgi:hypothetical protein|nr:hypothetical protein [Candidatus Saccharibacteria bacterium]